MNIPWIYTDQRPQSPQNGWLWIFRTARKNSSSNYGVIYAFYSTLQSVTIVVVTNGQWENMKMWRTTVVNVSDVLLFQGYKCVLLDTPPSSHSPQASCRRAKGQCDEIPALVSITWRYTTKYFVHVATSQIRWKSILLFDNRRETAFRPLIDHFYHYTMKYSNFTEE